MFGIWDTGFGSGNVGGGNLFNPKKTLAAEKEIECEDPYILLPPHHRGIHEPMEGQIILEDTPHVLFTRLLGNFGGSKRR